jgi:hypothetical protein
MDGPLATPAGPVSGEPLQPDAGIFSENRLEKQSSKRMNMHWSFWTKAKLIFPAAPLRGINPFYSRIIEDKPSIINKSDCLVLCGGPSIVYKLHSLVQLCGECAR